LLIEKIRNIKVDQWDMRIERREEEGSLGPFLWISNGSRHPREER
jgi:hypothetical protein